MLNLGSLKVNSLAKPKDDKGTTSVKQLVDMGKSEEDILTELRTHSYDKFLMKIVNFQVMKSPTKNEIIEVSFKVQDSH